MVTDKPRPNIMVVDDQEDITWSLSHTLSEEEINATVITANSGKEALDKLSGQTINLLISDIKMLDVDDQDLFIEIKKKYPAVSVIVMTTLPSAGLKKEALLGDNLLFIEKPFDINKLKDHVINIFDRKNPADLSQTGIILTDIVLIKCMGGSTTALQINKATKEGTIFFKDGELIHATFGKKEGEEAFFEILEFGKGVVTSSLFLETVNETITRPGLTLVREYIDGVEAERQEAARKEKARIKAAKEAVAREKAAAEEAARKKAEEEAAREKAEEEEARKKAEKAEEAARKKAEEEEEAARKKAEEEEAARKKAEEEEVARKKAEEEEEVARKKAEEEEEAARKKAEEEEETARKKAEEEEAARKKAEEEEAARKKVEEEEAEQLKIQEAAEREKKKAQIIQNGLKDLISGLSNIEDYVAAGVMAPSGKLLVHDSTDETLDLDELGSTFNKLYRKIRQTSKKVDFKACWETMFTYEERAVIMRRSKMGEKMYFHLMAIMDSNRNLDLVDKVMDDLQTRVQKKFSEL